MSPVAVLKAARAAGLILGIEGDDLVLEAVSAPPAAVLDALSRYKVGIVALLRPGQDGWSAEDWQVFFDERASIIEFDGGLPREVAEARAFACCEAEWLIRNPVHSPPGRCLGCCEAERSNVPLLPFGAETNGYAWLHSQCWSSWQAREKAEAVAALSTFGVPT